MAEMLPRPPTSPREPPSTMPASPSPGIVEAFVGVLTRPTAFFESVRGQTGFGAPILFALVMGLAAGALSAAIYGLGLGAARSAGIWAAIAGLALWSAVSAACGGFVGGAIVHAVAIVANGKGTYEQSVRIASYSLAVLPVGALLGIATFLPTIANLYAVWIIAAGVIAIHLGDRKRTFAAASVLALLVVVVGIAGALLARPLGASPDLPDGYGAGSDFRRDVEGAREEMRRAAEELQRSAERAKQGDAAK